MRVVIVTALLFLAHAGSVLGAACLSNATGNWNAPATWTGCTGGNGTPVNTPGTNDTATIRNAHTVTLTAAAAASSVSITSAAGAGTTSILNVSGQTLTIGGGTAGLNISGGTGTRRARLAISTGTVNAGSVSVNGGNAQITFSGAGTLNLTGNLQSGASFTASTGTVHFSGAALQSVGAYAYNILRVNNSTEAKLSGASSAVTVTIGDVTANSVFSDDGFQLTSAGTLNLTSGIFKLGGATSATSFPAFGTINIGAGTTVEYAAGPNGQVVSTAPAYQNLIFSGAGSKSVAAGTLSVAAAWAAGSPTRLDVNNTTVSLAGDLTGSGSITQGTALMTIAGSWLNTGTFTAGTGGVTLTGAGRQITGDPTNGITFTTLTVNGTYTNNNANATSGISASTTLGGTGTLTQAANSVLSLGGSCVISNLDATANPNTVIYNGGAAQSVKATTYHHLTINNASGATLAGDATVNGTLTLTAGDVSTDTSKLTIKSTGGVTGAGTAQHIIGNLEREFLVAGSFTYDLGDGTNYTPVTVNIGPLTTPGALTASVTNTDHPDTTAAASGIDASRSINRYWTLKNATLAGTLAPTFNYIDGTPVDRDAAAIAANFVIRRGASCSGSGVTRTCPSWSPATVSGLPTNTQAAASAVAVAVGDPEADFDVGEALNVSFSREQEFIYSREQY